MSYPGLTQTTDGTIVAVWQAQREDGGRESVMRALHASGY